MTCHSLQSRSLQNFTPAETQQDTAVKSCNDLQQGILEEQQGSYHGPTPTPHGTWHCLQQQGKPAKVFC